jgi:hypothetical protein
MSGLYVGIRKSLQLFDFSKDSQWMLETLLQRNSDPLLIDSNTDLNMVHDLINRSIVRWFENTTKDFICFICAAVECITYTVLCGSQKPVTKPSTLPEFLLEILPKVRQDFLNKNLRLGTPIQKYNDNKKRLYETVWQMEFY